MIYPITTLSIILICALVIVIAYAWYKTNKLKKQLSVATKSNVALTSINKENKVEIKKLKQLNVEYENSLTNMSVPSKPKTETIQPLHIKKESNVVSNDNKNSNEDLNNLATLAVVSSVILDDSDSNVKKVPITSMNDSFDSNAYNESNYKSSDSYHRSSDYGSSSSSSSYDSSSSDSSSSSSSSSD